MCQNGSVHPSHCTGAPGFKRGPSAFHSVAWSVGRSVARSVAQSVNRAVGRSVNRSTGQPVGRSVGRSVDRWSASFARYGCGSGRVSVTPAGFEVCGRIGDSCDSVLARLAAQSSLHRRSLQGPSRVFTRWLAEMGVASHNSMAKTAAEACRVHLPAIASESPEVDSDC